MAAERRRPHDGAAQSADRADRRHGRERGPHRRDHRRAAHVSEAENNEGGTMKQLNKRIAHLEMPDRFKGLQISDEGYPIPYFVGWVDGKPDFRLADPEKLAVCYRHRRCWLCGEPLGKFLAFVIGPMCAINRNTAEPPSHYDCALYACIACPFLSQPKMRRNEKDKP